MGVRCYQRSRKSCTLIFMSMKFQISESQRKEIQGFYNSNKGNIAIVELLSLNENYAIFLDMLIDIKNKKMIGNVWESMDNFKLFFNDSNTILGEEQSLIRNQINSLVIVEGSMDLMVLKQQYILMNEQVMDWLKSKAQQAGSAISGAVSDAGDWVKEKGSEAIAGVKKFGSTVVQGMKDLGKSISQFDLSKALEIVGKGVLYLARSLRSALYHPVGMVLDAILVASGIGKAAQFVLWAIVVALDVYELSTGDYEKKDETFGTRLLYTGVDILGLIFAGVAAKGARGLVGAFIRKFGSSTQGIKKGLQESPAILSTLTKMKEAVSAAPAKLREAQAWLVKKSPKIGNWLGGIIGGAAKIFEKIITFIGEVTIGAGKGALKVASVPGKVVKKGSEKIAKAVGAGKETIAKVGSGVQAGFNVGGVNYGLEKYGQRKAAQELQGINIANAEFDFESSL